MFPTDPHPPAAPPALDPRLTEYARQALAAGHSVDQVMVAMAPAIAQIHPAPPPPRVLSEAERLTVEWQARQQQEFQAAYGQG